MEKKIHDYFASETMDEVCSRRIENVLRSAPGGIGRTWLRVAAAAAAALVLVTFLFCNTEITPAMADFYDYPVHTQSPEETSPLGRAETDPSEHTDEEIIVGYGGLVYSENPNAAPPLGPNIQMPAEVRDGRLYFIANGEDIDITDLCSEEEAYVYVFQDNTGIWHYFIIGGTPEDWGYQIYLRDPSKDHGGWIVGGSAGAVTAASGWKYRQWAHDGKEKVGHPWSLIDCELPEE